MTNYVSPLSLDEKGELLRGKELIERVRELAGDTILLSFSRGKDSIAMWLYLREHFNIVPYYLYWIPSLEWVDESLAYYERFFGCHIIQLPHPLFWQYINSFFFQPPDRVAIIRALDFPRYDFADLDNILCDHHLGFKAYTAMGMRSADGIMRRNLMKQQGVIGTKRRRYFYPIWDWNIAQVSDVIQTNDVALPIDYTLWGRTVTDFTYQFLAGVRDNFPNDWRRVLDWFPLADLELFRYENIETA